jgi:hypothetical protein
MPTPKSNQTIATSYMKVLVFLYFCIVILFMLGMTAFLWLENPLWSIGGLIGITSFFIAYAISGDMIIAPRDFWRLSSWQVFKKKVGYALSTYIIVTFIAASILNVIFGK